MSITGKVYEKREVELATLEVTETDDYKIVTITVGGSVLVSFPLPKTADTNEIAVRTGNIIYQTGLVDNSVRVEVTET